MIDYKYAYLIGCLIGLAVWLFLFLYRKKIRKEMLFMSLLIAPLGPISEFFYFRDYWKPEYILNILGVGIEDLLFGFIIGGIAAAIYEEFFVKKFKRTKGEKNSAIILLGIIGIVLLILFIYFFKINSIYASSLGFLIIGIMILFRRRDLIKNAILSGILVALIMFIIYLVYFLIFPNLVNKWWYLKDISGILILKVPIEELIWGFSWGFLAGPFYEFWKGYKEAET